jgi:parallel beta-helix repeat protein
MKKVFTILFALALVAGVFVQNAQADVRYVTTTGAGSKNGTSWANAYPDTLLQTAINESGVTQVWVAKGTYKPTVNVGGKADRYKTFQMKNGVAIYGGFDGTETQVSQREISVNKTILSGDLNGDDNYSVSPWTGTSENCYHVFYHLSGLDLTSYAILDGFTIKGGNANGSSPHYDGGGMFNDGSSPTITNCTFTSNSASYGGGMYNTNSSSSTLTNCTFTSNSASYGGGMDNWNGSSPSLTNCTFSSNSAPYGGGGMYNESSSPSITNCTFSSNSTVDFGGGMSNNSSSPTLTNCTFSSNSAVGDHGGGMGNSYSSPTLTNCTFSSNLAAENGGGMYNYISSFPTITNCTFSSNSAAYSGGGMGNYISSPTITNCTFSSNSTGKNGGGMSNNSSSSTTLTNCTFSSNSAGIYGGGIYNESSSPTFNNCIIWGNAATDNGDEFYIYGGTTTLNYSCYANATWDVYIAIGTFTATNNNITSDPLFVGSSINPTHPYSILGISSCADAGNDSYNSEQYDVRGAGYPRKLNKTTGGVGTIDMGAYEYKIGDDPLTSVETGIASTPKKFTLSQNYPNPFNPATTISFSLAKSSFVSLKIFDLLGRDVATVVSEELPTGSYSKQWNAANMTSGIYFYRLQAGSFTETKKLIFLK